jgi:hypothetical protein
MSRRFGANSPQGSTASYARWCLLATVRGTREARSWAKGYKMDDQIRTLNSWLDKVVCHKDLTDFEDSGP